MNNDIQNRHFVFYGGFYLDYLTVNHCSYQNSAVVILSISLLFVSKPTELISAATPGHPTSRVANGNIQSDR